MNFAMEVMFSNNLMGQMQAQIKRAKEIQEIFATTPEIEVKADDGSIIRLELCKLQKIACRDCMPGEYIISFFFTK